MKHNLNFKTQVTDTCITELNWKGENKWYKIQNKESVINYRYWNNENKINIKEFCNILKWCEKYKLLSGK